MPYAPIEMPTIIISLEFLRCLPQPLLKHVLAQRPSVNATWEEIWRIAAIYEREIGNNYKRGSGSLNDRAGKKKPKTT